MSVELKVPVIGESVTEVTLSSWLKKDGEYVNEGEAVCEIESDKASMEKLGNIPLEKNDDQLNFSKYE